MDISWIWRGEVKIEKYRDRRRFGRDGVKEVKRVESMEKGLDVNRVLVLVISKIYLFKDFFFLDLDIMCYIIVSILLLIDGGFFFFF